MKTLKLEKITLNELTPNEQRDIQGGLVQAVAADDNSITVTIPITISLVFCTTTVTAVTKLSPCLTADPGHQDSCGLCSTKYAC
jgi:hypothetical protein